MPETSRNRIPRTLLPAIYQRAVIDAFVKLDPRQMIRNPVMFVVEIGSAITTLLWLQALTGNGEAPAGFIGAISAWLWFTVLFANFAEALAEGRGKAQAESLRKMRQDTDGKETLSRDTRSGKAGNLLLQIILLSHPQPCTGAISSMSKPGIRSRLTGR